MSGLRGAGPRRAAVAIVAGASLLPIAGWIPGGRSYPGYQQELSGWLSGTAIVVGVGFVLALLSERVPVLWRPGAAGRCFARFDPIRTGTLAAVAVAAWVGYLALAWWVFDARPLLIDEVVQALQARMYVAGRLWLPAPADPALQSIMHMVEHDGRVFGHFPVGGPLWLALGELVRAPWLAIPLAGAGSVFGWGLVLRAIEPRAAVRGAALLLFAIAPLPAFMAASHMNHTTVLMWVLLGTAALLAILRDPARLGAAAGLGASFGMAAITRPADALGWGAVAGIWLLLRLRADRRWLRPIAVAALAGLVPLALGAWVNLETTGSALRSGYQLLWGDNVGLGFHPAPFGPDHTPVRGVELVALYLLRLNVYLFESPLPSLLPALIGLAIVPALRPVDRYLLGAVALVFALYFGYWFDGFYLGPRFVHTAAPVAVLWTARLPGLIAERWGAGRALRVTCFGGAVAAVMTLAIGLPIRIGQYQGGFVTMRWDADQAATEAGIGNAVVLVRESWGAQLLARMWALGMPRPEAERVYRNVDACELDREIAALEQTEPKPSEGEVRGRLAPLMADSAVLISSPLSPDTTERARPGASYTGSCVARLLEDRAGFTLFAPLLLSRRDDLLFVRDLQGRSAKSVADRPGEDVYLLRRHFDEQLPRYEKVSRDSVVALR